ncbi:MAG: TolC family protein [Verrucomicrobiales bacterium]
MKKPLKKHLPLAAALLALPSCTSSEQANRLPLIEVRPASLELPQIAVKAHHRHDQEITITFANLAPELRLHNPQLAAARQLIAEAQGKLAQSGLKANPELEVSFETDRRLHELMLTAAYSQKFPRANRLLLEKKVSASLVAAAAEEVREVERQLLGQARQTLVAVLAFRQEKELLAAQEKNARELATFIKEAAARGELSPLDSASALIEAQRYRNRARQLDIKLTLALAELRPLFDLNADGEIHAPGTLPPPQLPPLIVASASRPDLAALRHRARSAADEVSLEQARKYDDIEAGVFAGVGRDDELENEQIIGLRVRIPLATNDTNAGAVAAADARYRRLHQEAEALQRRIRSELAAYYGEMQQWQELAASIKKELLPISQKHIAETQAAYERGEIPLQDVLRAQDQELSLQSARLDALREFHLAKSKYDMAADH